MDYDITGKRQRPVQLLLRILTKSRARLQTLGDFPGEDTLLEYLTEFFQKFGGIFADCGFILALISEIGSFPKEKNVLRRADFAIENAAPACHLGLRDC